MFTYRIIYSIGKKISYSDGWEDDDSKIEIDGVDISKLDMRDLRS